MKIRFASAGSEKVVTVAAEDTAGRSLLSVAREHGVPILFNCECGDCGACLVEVLSSAGRDGQVLPLTEKERFLLLAMSQARVGRTYVGSSDPGRSYRLACQCGIGDGDIEVHYLSDLGNR